MKKPLTWITVGIAYFRQKSTGTGKHSCRRFLSEKSNNLKKKKKQSAFVYLLHLFSDDWQLQLNEYTYS